ncbi:hypothetical protein EJB05_40409, partial [Eragrostis curvula]
MLRRVGRDLGAAPSGRRTGRPWTRSVLPRRRARRRAAHEGAAAGVARLRRTCKPDAGAEAEAAVGAAGSLDPVAEVAKPAPFTGGGEGARSRAGVPPAEEGLESSQRSSLVRPTECSPGKKGRASGESGDLDGGEGGGESEPKQRLGAGEGGAAAMAAGSGGVRRDRSGRRRWPREAGSLTAQERRGEEYILTHHTLINVNNRTGNRTSILSRRWRTLWCQEDAVDLDTESYSDGEDDGEGVGWRLFRDAMAIAGASGRCPVRTLNFTAWSDYHSNYLDHVMRTSPGMDSILAAPAVQRLEELRVELGCEFAWSTCGAYELPPSCVPCRCLRVLELAGCTLGPPGAAVFACLETLLMKTCEASPENLQAMLDVAPNLESLRLDPVYFRDRSLGLNTLTVMSKPPHVRLRCPASVVDVALIHCHTTDGLDLEAPNVVVPRAESAARRRELPQERVRCNNPPSRKIQRHAFFWESIGGFSSLQTLKLKVKYIRDIAVYGDQEDMLLNMFPRLELLEVEGSCQKHTRGAAIAVGNLLQCCPALQEFRLKFSLHSDPSALYKRMIDLTEERRAQMDLESSMGSLTKLKSKNACPSSDDDYGGRDDMKLGALDSRTFPCLISRLKKIRLQFQLECFNCFEVKLAKFFVENARVLEEMEVHDGDQRVYSHIHNKLAEWRANSFRSIARKRKRSFRERVNIIVGEHSAVSSLKWDRIEEYI